MEERFRHMEMIQGIINRLSTNSFLLKGWSVMLVSALFAFAAKDAAKQFVFFAYFPVFAFWALDAYFLRQERLFRELYDHVRELPSEQVDFSMNTRPFDGKVSSVFKLVFSKTLGLFHGTVAFTVLVVMLLMVNQ